MNNDLLAFLRAQLDEDERVAQGADVGDLLGWVEVATPHGDAAEEHVIRWDSARVLAEVGAKRALLDWAGAWLERGCAPWNADAIRLLAQPYAGRDGWREEWRA